MLITDWWACGFNRLRVAPGAIATDPFSRRAAAENLEKRVVLMDAMQGKRINVLRQNVDAV